MLTTEAHVPTERASRYLVQLCRHLGQMSRMRHRPPTHDGGQAPPAVRHVDWSDNVGTIGFTQGTCTLRATADTLVLRIEADDEDTLQRLQDGITRRLGTIGRRDRLTVHWRQSTSEADLPPEDTTTDTAAAAAPARPPRRIGQMLVVVAVAAVAILVHVGILGATLAASAWASWGANIVLVIIAVKIITVALHGVLGRVAFRHRGILRRWTRGHGSSSVNVEDAQAHGPERAA